MESYGELWRDTEIYSDVWLKIFFQAISITKKLRFEVGAERSIDGSRPVQLGPVLQLMAPTGGSVRHSTSCSGKNPLDIQASRLL